MPENLCTVLQKCKYFNLLYNKKWTLVYYTIKSVDFSYPVNKQLITKGLQNCTNAMSYLKECSISETERMWIQPWKKRQKLQRASPAVPLKDIHPSSWLQVSRE